MLVISEMEEKTSNSLPPFKLKRGEIYARKKTEEALRQKLDEVKRFNKLMVGREPAIIKVGAVSWLRFGRQRELAIMRLHPVKGAEILQPIKQLKDIIPAVRHHHEFYDGTGYPDGLKGEAVSLHARILPIP